MDVVSVIIRDAGPTVGKGLFATAPIKKGDFIAEYTGKRVTTAVADASKSRYLFEIDKDWTLDAENEKSEASYINHSCIPNAEADVKKGRVLIHAIHDIEKGEEITIDYGEEYFDEFIKPVGCKCVSCLSA